MQRDLRLAEAAEAGGTGAGPMSEMDIRKARLRTIVQQYQVRTTLLPALLQRWKSCESDE